MELHNYQKYCIDFIKTHETAVLLLDMGLGKSVITLTALKELNLPKVLVIAPLRVAHDTWPNEIKKWEHLRGLTYSLILGSPEERISGIKREADIYIINRENVSWIVKYFIENGVTWPFTCVVIDELSSFKNYRSQRFKYLRKIRPFVKRWIGLTGTPASNGLMDLWSEIGILDGGERLGRFIGRYREAYFSIKSYDPRTGVVYSYIPRAGAEEQIYSRISDITISMKALDFLKMPECLYIRHEAVLDKNERILYDRFKKDTLLHFDKGDIDAASAGNLSLKLLQMSNGAVYNENNYAQEIHQKKLDVLEDLIEEANGQPVLVAYWFRHDRERILKRFKDAQDLNITEWNAGKQSVALIHPASAGHGLNIQQGGHILIWFGLTWSLELYQQTNARLWRQGQEHTVTIHHIITQNTIDEKVLAALESKNVTQSKLIEAVKAMRS